MVFPSFNYRVFMARIQYAMHVSVADEAFVAALMMRKTNGRQLELHLERTHKRGPGFWSLEYRSIGAIIGRPRMPDRQWRRT
jgi:hypothetical protein